MDGHCLVPLTDVITRLNMENQSYVRVTPFLLQMEVLTFWTVCIVRNNLIHVFHTLGCLWAGVDRNMTSWPLLASVSLGYCYCNVQFCVGYSGYVEMLWPT